MLQISRYLTLRAHRASTTDRAERLCAQAYFKLYDDNIIFFSDYRINTPGRCVLATFIIFINTAVNTYIGLEVGSW